jgi:hypothetical protein
MPMILFIFGGDLFLAILWFFWRKKNCFPSNKKNVPFDKWENGGEIKNKMFDPHMEAMFCFSILWNTWCGNNHQQEDFAKIRLQAIEEKFTKN